MNPSHHAGGNRRGAEANQFIAIRAPTVRAGAECLTAWDGSSVTRCCQTRFEAKWPPSDHAAIVRRPRQHRLRVLADVIRVRSPPTARKTEARSWRVTRLLAPHRQAVGIRRTLRRLWGQSPWTDPADTRYRGRERSDTAAACGGHRRRRRNPGNGLVVDPVQPLTSRSKFTTAVAGATGNPTRVTYLCSPRPTKRRTSKGQHQPAASTLYQLE